MENKNNMDPEVLCPFKRWVYHFGNPYKTDDDGIARSRTEIEFGECDLWDCMAYIPPENDRDADGKFVKGKCALCVPQT